MIRNCGLGRVNWVECKTLIFTSGCFDFSFCLLAFASWSKWAFCIVFVLAIMMQMMKLKDQKTVRFYPGGDDKLNVVVLPTVDPTKLEKSSLSMYKVSSSYLVGDGGFQGGRGRSTTTQYMFGKSKKTGLNNILDPESEIVLKWNWVFIISGLIALFIDPLYFYLPSIGGDEKNSCVNTDVNLQILVTFFRTIAVSSISCILLLSSGQGIFYQGPVSLERVLLSACWSDGSSFQLLEARNRSEKQCSCPHSIASIYSTIISIIPLKFPNHQGTSVVTKTAWAGAAYNLLFYILTSHVLGAAWYLLSFDRYTHCWKSKCRREKSPNKCILKYLNCDDIHVPGRAAWNVVSANFIDKYFYCLWWGLQQLSSYGQNLQASTFIGETLFAILIAIFGLVLFAHLIGNMQTYLQSITQGLEAWRLKRRDTEEWMTHRLLPEDLKHRVIELGCNSWGG
ncbi:Cyclic nucleotide-gated ion channel 17-like protein [Drosera capensis]